MRNSWRVWLTALFLLSCSGCLSLGPKKSTETPVQVKRLRLDCAPVSGIDPMELCGDTPKTYGPNCSTEYSACDLLKQQAAICWAAHKALVDCVTRHNEGAE